jgi:hypothetical protein
MPGASCQFLPLAAATHFQDMFWNFNAEKMFKTEQPHQLKLEFLQGT